MVVEEEGIRFARAALPKLPVAVEPWRLSPANGCRSSEVPAGSSYWVGLTADRGDGRLSRRAWCAPALLGYAPLSLWRVHNATMLAEGLGYFF